jgi:hypothetical protein
MGKREYTFIIAYGPNEDENVEIKDTFSKELQKATDRPQERLLY